MKYTDIGAVDLDLMSCHEAAKLPPVSAKDKAVTIHCHGEEERWNSREVATAFYRLGAIACGGSECERYNAIWTGLVCGDTIPTDGMPLRKRKAA